VLVPTISMAASCAAPVPGLPYRRSRSRQVLVEQRPDVRVGGLADLLAFRDRLIEAGAEALLTAAVVVSNMVTTSVAGKASTSRSMSTARCRGGRYCRRAMSASRRLLVVHNAFDGGTIDHATGQTRAQALVAEKFTADAVFVDGTTGSMRCSWTCTSSARSYDQAV
jgi:hypothetical protein